MSESRLLMIFVKNPEKGRVKTRLAETVGAQKALEIYRKLVDHTLSIAQPLAYDKEVWYSRFLPDKWARKNGRITHMLQSGNDLGEKMSRAFHQAFEKKYQQVIIIGSDCAELTTGILNEAYQRLEENDLVIGPAEDGGYYLLGMKSYHRRLFEDIPWSTSRVLSKTLAAAEELKLKTHLLVELNDVDRAEDWKRVKGRL